jgi:ABC-type Fe3+ transport system substrate-binding protein
LDQKIIALAFVAILVLGGGYVIFFNNPGGNQVVTATIKGKVTDSNSTVLSGVSVSAGGKTSVTGNDGLYSFTLDKGTYNVEAKKTGYDTKTGSVSATEAKTYVLNFTLTLTKPKEVVLKVLTRHGSDITYNSKIAFLASDVAKKYNIVDIKWYGISGTLWVDTIKLSQDFDVAWGGGPVLFDVLMNERLLAPLSGNEINVVLNQLPSEIGGMPLKRVKNNTILWAGAAISSFGFTLNKEYLTRENLPDPTKWIDLASEVYASTLPNPSVGTADALKSTSNTRIFEIILQGYGWNEGWKILTRMGANSRIYDMSELVRDSAISGNIGVGTTIDFYGYTAQLENPELCKYILPEDGTLINPDPIALLKTSPNAEAAQAFITWCLSTEGQKVWLIPTINRMPANPAVFNTTEGLQRADLKEIYELTKQAAVIPFSDDVATSYENSLMNYYSATIVRSQLKLVDFWMKLTSAYKSGKITKPQYDGFILKLGNPEYLEFIDPISGLKQKFTEVYAISINSQMGSDATYRTKIVDAIVSAAETRYDSFVNELNQLTG